MSSGALDFEAIAREQRAAIRRGLLRRGVPARDLDDAAQDVLQAIARRLPSFAPTDPTSIPRWIGAICVRIGASYHRTAYRRGEVLMEGDELEGLLEVHGTAESPEEQGLRGELLARGLRLVEQIDPEAREVFKAYAIDGLDISTIAAAQGICDNTAWTRLRIARLQVRAGMTRELARERGR